MDFTLEQLINGPAGSHPLWDTLMKAAATLAEPLFIAVVALRFLIGWLRREPADRQGAIAALIAAGGALLVNQVIGHVWDRPRPFMAHPGAVHLLVKHSTDPSFPSDHAAAAFAVAAVLFSAHRRLGAIALALAAVLAYARVYVGDHYPGDVAGGALAGVLVALVIITWFRTLPDLASRLLDAILIRLRFLPRA